MKELRHCMLDLESMDLLPSSKIVSIGATIFDPRYGKIGDSLYMELDWKAQTARTSGNGVPEWWKKQSKEARAALKGTIPLEEALDELDFFLPDDCKVWGNGATFDISMLEDAYRGCDMEIPWKFWNVRDCRTIKDMYESARGGWDKKSGGVLHNAKDDAIFQAQYVIGMWKSLLKQ